ncbi:tyrosine-type recombinase/integrase, partial [Listeria monocytogenes]|uniref:tyrosine-type recombinase/integrase n=1 Tax=Listeria monocytogenes TaxID=1639 RepID=UPI0013C4A30F
YVPFGEYAEDAITDYLPERANLMSRYKKSNDALLVNHYGDPLTTRGIRYSLSKIISKASVTRKFNPHMLRQTFATDLLNTGAD